MLWFSKERPWPNISDFQGSNFMTATTANAVPFAVPFLPLALMPSFVNKCFY